jgi:hypothetical protein
MVLTGRLLICEGDLSEQGDVYSDEVPISGEEVVRFLEAGYWVF